MGYVLVGLLVVVIVAAGVTVLILSSRRHGRELGRASRDEEYGKGVPGSDTAIFAADPDVPLGDTAEHAGQQEGGATVGEQDAERSGGSRRPPSEAAGTPRRDGAHSAPPVDGGEGEGRRRV